MNIYLGPSFSRFYERRPLVLIDVGSRGGLAEHWKHAEEYLLVIGFEPDVRSYEELSKTERSYRTSQLNLGLYNEKTCLNLYLTRRPGDSSILKPDRRFLDRFPESRRFDIVETTKISVDTLDNQLRQQGIADVDFIKVDTQGTELHILQGAANTLSQVTLGLEIEVEFSQMYEDQPLFADIDSFVRGLGFQLFDLKPYYWKREAGQNYGGPKGQIIYADALYLRELDSLVSLVNSLQDIESSKSKVLRALSLCAIYGYQDYALEIVEATNELFDETEIQLLLTEATTREPVHDRIPNFRGRARLSTALALSSNILKKPQQHGWRRIGSGEVLGNFE